MKCEKCDAELTEENKCCDGGTCCKMCDPGCDSGDCGCSHEE